MNRFARWKSAGSMLSVVALAVLLMDVDTFAGIETKGLRVTQEGAILLAKAEAVRTKRANSIEDITRVEVVTDPGKHDWDKDKKFNGEGYYKDSKLKHKKYWEIFFAQQLYLSLQLMNALLNSLKFQRFHFLNLCLFLQQSVYLQIYLLVE